MTFLKKLFLFLVLVSLSATGVMYLLQPLQSLENNLSIYNNDLVCQKEIKSIVLSNFEENQPFIKYNPLQFSERIKEHPLIKDVAIRTNVLSANKFSILINEEKPWAMFRNKIFNEEFKMIKDFDLDEDQKDFDSVYDLYNSTLNLKSPIVQIKSNHDLERKDLKSLKKIIDQVNERLNMIKHTSVIRANIIDQELTLKTIGLKLILGQYKSNTKDRIKKLDYLLDKIKDHILEIEYIDLSLDTDEAIIGKRL